MVSFVSAQEERYGVEARRCCQRFASWLGIGERQPDLLMRFGRGPQMARSVRRPAEQVVEDGASG